MSNNAFLSDWVTLERTTVLFRDPTNKDRRFIPLLLNDCRIPDILQQFRYVDWRTEDEGQYKKLIDLMLPRSHSTTRSVKDREWLRQSFSNVNRHILYGSVSPSDGVGVWFFGSARWLDKDALIIIFFMEAGLNDAVAIQRVKNAIARRGIEWLVPLPDLWILRTDLLRSVISPLSVLVMYSCHFRPARLEAVALDQLQPPTEKKVKMG